MQIEVKNSKYGRGVFALKAISKGVIIEECPVLLLPNTHQDNALEDQLARFQFTWINDLKCLSLGYGSMYNHSPEPNAVFLPNYKNKTITFIALRDIEKGEEILSNYGYDPKDQSEIEVKIEHQSKTDSELSQFIIDETIRGLTQR